MDVCLSAILLFLSLPVLLISALIIRITSPGPILFRQQRMGRDFRPFAILKLRTMAHAEPGPAYTLGPGPRITPFGGWLRRTKIDELPQLWNVLRGEMSLVGPRPVIPEITAEYLSRYSLLLRARPGLTDPASLKYSQEARFLGMVDDPVEFYKTVVIPDKLRVSLQYMERANVWTDLTTMVMTTVVCCFPSLSTVYGELPETTGHVADRKPKEVRIFIRPAAPAKERTFSGSSGRLEPAGENGLHSVALPGILLQISAMRSGSTSTTATEGISRL
jgi:lipopolysaccharide/colanic/teichoic acid biosynthesis glycosyltransferase